MSQWASEVLARGVDIYATKYSPGDVSAALIRESLTTWTGESSDPRKEGDARAAEEMLSELFGEQKWLFGFVEQAQRVGMALTKFRLAQDTGLPRSTVLDYQNQISEASFVWKEKTGRPEGPPSENLKFSDLLVSVARLLELSGRPLEDFGPESRTNSSSGG